MDAKPNPDNEAGNGAENPLPVGEPTPATTPVDPTTSVVPPSIKDEVARQLAEYAAQERENRCRKPLAVSVVRDDELSSFEKKTVLFGKVGLGIAVLSFAAAAIAACLVFQQFKEMALQSDLLGASVHQARSDSNASSKSTATQLDLLRLQLTQQDSATRKELQPYVFLQHMDLASPFTPNVVVKVSNSYINGGRTPAFDVHSDNTEQDVIDGKRPKFVFKQASDGNGTIAPGGTYDLHLEIRPHSQPEIHQFATKVRKIYMVGRITYSDVFHQVHHTRYCIVFDPATGQGITCKHPGHDD